MSFAPIAALRRAFAFIVFAMSMLAILTPAMAEDRVLTLTLIETVPAPAREGWPSVASGAITQQDVNGNYTVQHTWSAPPQTMGADGFTITLTTAATVLPTTNYAGGASENSTDFSSDPDEAYAKLVVDVGVGGGSRTVTAQVTPYGLPADGAVLELNIGAAYGPRVVYKYRASYTGGDGETPGAEDDPGEPESQLAVTTDCPSIITISAYPPILCHLYVTGFRRNTADAIFVELPLADGFGNQPNGLNVVGRTQHDVYDLGDTFVTDLLIYACPSPANEARNCFDNATLPGVPITVPVLVRQGEQAVQIDLPFTPNSSSKDKDTQPGIDNPTLMVTNRVYIFGAWRRDSFLNVQDNTFQFSPVTSWADAEWVGEKLADANGEFIRLCLARDPNTCLLVVGGALALAPVARADPASHWQTPFSDAAGGIANIQNRAFPKLFLHARDGVPAVAEIDFNWPEAQWGMQLAQ
ncbi:hypothetical protein sos41_19260 [Alphaproteobacteria bacterium SO-S41]|nr:hypothetical protein sos41_19260 [Alphaproteobacteria bacterium SO-S41]